MNEANAIIDCVSLNERSAWEKTRWLAYIQALTSGAKLKNPQDLTKFSWEINEMEKEETKDSRTKEEVLKQFERFLQPDIKEEKIYQPEDFYFDTSNLPDNSKEM